MDKPISIVWFRQDLRIEDNPALTAACEKGAVIPLFIWSPDEEGEWSNGAASRWWLHHSLERLSEDLKAIGLTLIVRAGKSQEVLQEIAKETHAASILYNRCYEPARIKQDRAIHTTLTEQGVSVESFPGNLLFEPWTILNKQQKPFRVFTPFWNTCLKNRRFLKSSSSDFKSCSGEYRSESARISFHC